jgi:hypothetical protein
MPQYGIDVFGRRSFTEGLYCSSPCSSVQLRGEYLHSEFLYFLPKIIDKDSKIVHSKAKSAIKRGDGRVYYNPDSVTLHKTSRTAGSLSPCSFLNLFFIPPPHTYFNI